MSTESPTIQAFYSTLAGDYDLMTRDASRWNREAPVYKRLRSEWHFTDVLDAGCGTGGEALALAELGCNVVGIDATPEFVDRARAKAAERGIPAVFHVDDLRSLKNVRDHSVDLAICRGNTLPHLLTINDLNRALKSFARVSRPGGRLILQWLNYTPILNKRERLVGVTGDDNIIFVRFYDFVSAGHLTFNIMALRRADTWKSKWASTQLRPWLPDELASAAQRIGWDSIELAASLSGEPFLTESSRDVVLFARRRSR